MRKKLRQRANRWLAVSRALGVVALAVCALFVVVQFRSSWQGPRIETSYPVPGLTVHDPVVIISGVAHNIAQLYISGVPTPIQLKTHQFVAELALPLGATSITLDGYSRSGKHTRSIIPILYELPRPGQPLPHGIELLQRLDPTEIPFRATSDLLELIQRTQ